MPEKINFVPALEPEKKPKKDITKGEITEEGAWRSEELGNLEANSNNSNPQGLREVIIPKKEKPSDQIIKTEKRAEQLQPLFSGRKVPKENPLEIRLQKSDNVVKMGEPSYLRSEKYSRRRQEDIEKQKRMTRRAHRPESSIDASI